MISVSQRERQPGMLTAITDRVWRSFHHQSLSIVHASFFRFARPSPGRARKLFSCLLLLCWPLRAGAITVSLGFEGCPPVIYGQPGEVIAIEVFPILTIADNATGDGPQAWQISLTAEG